jgi:penicillin-binding protein 1B
LEVAVAFSTLANQGIRVTPLPIKRIANQEGETLERRSIQVEQAVPPEDAYMLTHLLEGVIERGTGRSARQQGFDRPAAGKTGTTNDFGDAWFVGYTPDLLAVVWVGFDHRESLDLSGGQAALPIWTEFMKRATAGRPVTCFTPPPGVVLEPSGRVMKVGATPFCPAVTEEVFYADQEPIPLGPRPIPDTLPLEVHSFPASRPVPETEAVEADFPSASPPSAPLPRRPVEERPWWRLF